MLICIWCEEAPADNPRRVCETCWPGGRMTHCTIPGHLPTCGDACAECTYERERYERHAERNAAHLRQLYAIRADHVRDFNKPWPGCEFGKTIIGRAFDAAIRDAEGPYVLLTARCGNAR